MPQQSLVSDEALSRALGVYAGLVSRVLDNPQRWLGVDEHPPLTAGLPVRLLDALRDHALGDVTPASAEWRRQSEATRVNWWLRRIAIGGALAAAAPRFVGALADRIPLQAALGAAAAGLAVCVVARERGADDPADWVPLLARVLFDRDLSAAGPAVVPNAEQCDDQLTTAIGDTSEPPSSMSALAVELGGSSGPCGGWPGLFSTCKASSTSAPAGIRWLARWPSCP